MNKILIGTTILISLIVGGCSSNPGTTSSTTPSSTANSSTTTTPIAKAGDMTLKELAKYTGQNGSPAYVAVNGVIYDVSNAKGWKNGMHKGGVKAGADLTKMMAQSPHGDSVLKDLPVIGKLK